jgi:hypothetical protein
MNIIQYQPSEASSTKSIMCGSIRPLKINYIRMKIQKVQTEMMSDIIKQFDAVKKEK